MQSKDRTYQVIAIVALVIGVCALTVGFAAFTTNLTINSAAQVRQNSSVLDVVFSTSNSSVVSGSVTPTGTNTATGNTATLTNTTVSGIKANFTEPGQKVTYTFYVYNNSAFTGYLTAATFKNASGGSAFKVCTPSSANGNAAATYTDACADITLKLTVEDKLTAATQSMTAAEINDTIGMATKTAKLVTVEIEYPAGSHTADGDFDVAFGDIDLTYSSVKGV